MDTNLYHNHVRYWN